jgi:hypothetical protein
MCVERWWPANDTHCRCHEAWRIVRSPMQHHPEVRHALINPAVAELLAVFRSPARGHKDELECDPARLVEHGICAYLYGGSLAKVAIVGWNGGVYESVPGYAVRHLGCG